jgi:hypothetical protein
MLMQNLAILIKTSLNVSQKMQVYSSSGGSGNLGAYSQVRCELELLEAAVKDYHDYYHLLSGADLPIKSQDQIHKFL